MLSIGGNYSGGDKQDLGWKITTSVLSQSDPTFAAAAAALFEIANPAQTQQANMEEKRGERMDWVEKEQDRKRRNNIDEAMDRLKNKTHEQY